MSYTYHAAVSVAACCNAKRSSYNNLHRPQTGLMIFSVLAVTWSETVGHTTRPVSDQKQNGLGLGVARGDLCVSLGLAGLVLCCETRS